MDNKRLIKINFVSLLPLTYRLLKNLSTSSTRKAAAFKLLGVDEKTQTKSGKPSEATVPIVLPSFIQISSHLPELIRILHSPFDREHSWPPLDTHSLMRESIRHGKLETKKYLYTRTKRENWIAKRKKS